MPEDLDALWNKAKPIQRTPTTAPEDLDALWESAKPLAQAKRVGEGRSFALGASQGGTFGFADELGGALAKLLLPKSSVKFGAAVQPSADDTPEVRAAKEAALAQQAAQPTNYELVRDRMRAELEQARQENPGLVTAGEIGAGVLLPVPGGAAAQGAGLGARLLRAAGQGAAQGALYGAGSSEAGSAGGVAGDALKGFGIGALGGAVGEGLVSGGKALLGAVRGRAARGAQEALEQQSAKRLAQDVAEEASKAGKVGGTAQAASRDIEVIMNQAQALPVGHPTRIKAEEYLASPKGQQELADLVETKLASSPRRLDEREAAKAALREFQETRPERLAAQVAEDMANPVRKHVLPRIATMGHRMLPVIVGGTGAALGGAEGAAIGGTLGTLATLTTGAPGTALRNMMRTPAVRQAFWEAVQGVAGTGQPGRFSRAASYLDDFFPKAPSRTASRQVIDALPDFGPALYASEEEAPSETQMANARTEALRRRRR